MYGFDSKTTLYVVPVYFGKCLEDQLDLSVIQMTYCCEVDLSTERDKEWYAVDKEYVDGHVYVFMRL